MIDAYRRLHLPSARSIDPVVWIDSPYRPTLTIVQAAEELYASHDVREINHRYADNLTGTTDCLVEAIDSAQRGRRRILCFVTGVPGAGKTLAGLQAVHNPVLRRDGRPAGVFLSGNGPLVKIVSAALARSPTDKGLSKKERLRHVRTFIQNVHAFLNEHLIAKDRVPPEHVIIFDEAQRAWDARQMQKKKDVARSEPDLLLEVAARSPDWTVVIALVGGGQEIHNGEAGLAEWGKAVSSSPLDWEVWASPEALSGGASVAGARLFAENAGAVGVKCDSRLHLDVSVRSHRAQRIAEWVNHIVTGNSSLAASVASEFGEFPVVVTRDLETARNWLKEHCDPEHRAGLIASSGALRLRAFGIELSSGFRQTFPYEHWFLGPSEDSRSSGAFEVAASEFEIQGLELDWTCLCWGNDLWQDGHSAKWAFQKLSGAKWQRVKSAVNQQYVLNKYRVLLTRARQGMVIWVPRGRAGDATLLPKQFDGTAEFLRAAGIQSL